MESDPKELDSIVDSEMMEPDKETVTELTLERLKVTALVFKGFIKRFKLAAQETTMFI